MRNIWSAAFAGASIGFGLLIVIALAEVVIGFLVGVSVTVVAIALGGGALIGVAAEVARVASRRAPATRLRPWDLHNDDPGDLGDREEIPWDRHDPFDTTVYGDSEDDHQ